LVISSTAGPWRTARADDVVVELISGRILTGDVDSLTNDRRLCLRFTSGSAALVRAYAWSSIARVNVAGRWMTADEFQESAPSLATRLTWDSLAPDAAVREDGMDRSQREPRRRVAGFYLDAYTANWDADVESDGLVLHVHPFRDDGLPVAADATLEVELIGFHRTREGVQREFVQLGDWGHLLEAADFGDSGALVRLPYQDLHPEFDLKIGGTAVVHARLLVPGEGAFEASTGAIPLRWPDLVRDRLELRAGRRFFPTERTQREP
jgi:hypothetical protein